MAAVCLARGAPPRERATEAAGAHCAGITRDDPNRILAGAIAITALALLTDALLRFAEAQTAISRARRATQA